MADDLKWKDFDKFHAIRRLRELVGNWFKVQVNFTDAKGLLRGVPDGKFFNPLNHEFGIYTFQSAATWLQLVPHHFSRFVFPSRKLT